MARQNKSKYVPKYIILMQQLHLLLVAFLFGTVLYDSFVHTLPFYYVLFFLLGRLLGWVFNYTQILQWNETDQKVVKVQDKTALVIFIAFALFRMFVLPSAVEWTIHPRLLSDALFLITAGVFYSGISIYAKQLNGLVWRELVDLRERIAKTGEKGDNVND